MDPIYIPAEATSDKTLILCEGTSALSFIRGLLQVLGRTYGALALGGVFPNYRSTSSKGGKAQTALITALGLDFKRQYQSVKKRNKLNYKHVLLAFDADHSGTRNAGLVISMLALHWPALMTNGFVSFLSTPTVDSDTGTKTLSLGSISLVDAPHFYEEVKTGHHRVAVDYDYKRDELELEKAFCKNDKWSDERKSWLQNELLKRKERQESGDQVPVVDIKPTHISVQNFIQTDLLSCFIEQIDKRIPSLMDGQTIVRQKVLFASFHKKAPKVLSVPALSGWVDVVCSYPHAEKRLNDAIIAMADPNSNNIQLMLPIGDAGNATVHYIKARLSPLARCLFPPEFDDFSVQQHLSGDRTQPDFYLPILPMVLVNGAFGLAPGWQCKIKQHSPRVIIEKTKSRISGNDDLLKLTPWLKGTAMSEDGQVFAVKMPNGTVQTFVSAEALYDAWYETRLSFLCIDSTEQKVKEKWLEQLDALESKLHDKKQKHQQQDNEQHHQQDDEHQQQQLRNPNVVLFP